MVGSCSTNKCHISKHSYILSVSFIIMIINLICLSYLLHVQLVYQLFTRNVAPGHEEVKIVMQMAEEAIRAQERDPYTAFTNRVREINYGNSYFFRVCTSAVFFLLFSSPFLKFFTMASNFLFMQPIRISELKKVNPIRACEYFNNCFKDPSSFTVVIVGNIDPASSLPLVLQYLVRIALL